jgi:MFS family permease
MGIYSSSQFFGAFLGGALGGALLQHFSYQALFAALAVIGLIWLAVASTLQLPPRAQRLSLQLSVSNAEQANTLAAQLTRLQGVQEVTIVLAEQRCYLKVSSAQFDTAQAQAVITAAGA